MKSSAEHLTSGDVVQNWPSIAERARKGIEFIVDGVAIVSEEELERMRKMADDILGDELASSGSLHSMQSDDELEELFTDAQHAARRRTP